MAHTSALERLIEKAQDAGGLLMIDEEALALLREAEAVRQAERDVEETSVL
jgi:hypothetical protein